jgi:hypothetical protein
MLGFAAGFEMDVGVVASGSGGLQRIVLLLLRELLKFVVNFLRDEVALFDPALEPAIGPDMHEAPFAIENLNTVTVLYSPNLAINSGHTVSKNGLGNRHVADFRGFLASATARE